MYLAPLNYDRFFKKVFSDLTVAQAFLSDVFGVPVEIIEKLERKNRVTDLAKAEHKEKPKEKKASKIEISHSHVDPVVTLMQSIGREQKGALTGHLNFQI